jgi:hypothetical protein
VSAVLVSYFIANQFSQGSDRIWIGAFAIPVLIGLQAWRRYRLSRRLGAEPLHIGGYLLLTGCGIAITFGAVHLMTVYNNDGFRVGACANNRAELVSCSDTTALYSVYKLTDTANDCANTYTELTNGTIACVYPRTP